MKLAMGGAGGAGVLSSSVDGGGQRLAGGGRVGRKGESRDRKTGGPGCGVQVCAPAPLLTGRESLKHLLARMHATR